MKVTNTARVHRFHDKVAMHIGDGDTVYVTPEFAQALAEKLIVFAHDCATTKFTESTLTATYVGDEPK